MNNPGSFPDISLCTELINDVLANPNVTEPGYAVVGDTGFFSVVAKPYIVTVSKKTKTEAEREKARTPEEKKDNNFFLDFIYHIRQAAGV